jgi:hypothetical protein
MRPQVVVFFNFLLILLLFLACKTMVGAWVRGWVVIGFDCCSNCRLQIVDSKHYDNKPVFSEHSYCIGLLC